MQNQLNKNQILSKWYIGIHHFDFRGCYCRYHVTTNRFLYNRPIGTKLYPEKTCAAYGMNFKIVEWISKSWNEFQNPRMNFKIVTFCRLVYIIRLISIGDRLIIFDRFLLIKTRSLTGGVCIIVNIDCSIAKLSIHFFFRFWVVI